jgi:hypothetical protein
MEEKMKILKLLEEGKISAEEAIKLLEALKGVEPPHKDIVKGVSQMIECASGVVKDISRTISEAVKEKMREATEKAKEASERVKRAAAELKKKK